MVEGLRHGAAVCLLLQVVVTDLGSGIQSLFDVAILKRPEHLVVMVSPHACVEVGLQLQTHTRLVVSCGVFAVLRHLVVGGVKGAQEVLDMMSHFVSDDVSVGEVAVSPNLTFHALEELQVEIYGLVGRAIEWSAIGSGTAATRVHCTGKDDHLRGTVGHPHLPELLRPHVFGTGKNLFAELHELHIHLAVVLPVGGIFRAPALGHLLQYLCVGCPARQ